MAAVYKTASLMRVHWIQHADHEGNGSIGEWLARRGWRVTCSALHRGDALPPASSFDWLIVMGGPMNIYEEEAHPWLRAEKDLIHDACVMNKRILGICLGGQLLADVLGGPTVRNKEPEIGWFEVRYSKDSDKSGLFADFPETFHAFHWHTDTFAIPPRASVLMSSEACPNQAFTWDEGRCVGLQFHLEVRPDDVAQWIKEDAPAPARYVQPAGEMLADLDRFRETNRLMTSLLDRMAARDAAPGRGDGAG